VADGAIDAAAFARQLQERKSSGGSGGSSSGSSGSSSIDGGGSPGSSLDGAAAATELGAPPPRRERFVLLRGVQWGAPDMDSARMWRSLVRVWPKPLEASPSIVVHEGVGEMAQVGRSAAAALRMVARRPACISLDPRRPC
jgi:hypothetical protein